jgi:hypothetical protein
MPATEKKARKKRMDKRDAPTGMGRHLSEHIDDGQLPSKKEMGDHRREAHAKFNHLLNVYASLNDAVKPGPSILNIEALDILQASAYHSRNSAQIIIGMTETMIKEWKMKEQRRLLRAATIIDKDLRHMLNRIELYRLERVILFATNNTITSL